MTEEIDWKIAEEHIEDCIKAAEEVSKIPGVLIGFYMNGITSLKTRLKNGERSPEFFQEIMRFKL
jgi:hypothetical protein